MKQKILIIVLLSVISLHSNLAQSPIPLPVFDVVKYQLEIQTIEYNQAASITQNNMLEQMNQIQLAMERADKQLKKIQKMADFMLKIQSMKNFLELIETVSCLGADLELALFQLDYLHHSYYCRLSFRLQGALNGLEIVGDLITMILSSSIGMDKNKRMEMFEQMFNRYKDSAVLMSDIKNEILLFVKGQEFKVTWMLKSETMNYKMVDIRLK